MSSKKLKSGNAELDHILAAGRELRLRRGNLYRDQALKILPWICAWCGREFTSKKLHELTVHHKDRDHNNNPSDGSNWELLCMYCHESEHSRSLETDGGENSHEAEERPATYNPFADLQRLVQKKDKNE